MAALCFDKLSNRSKHVPGSPLNPSREQSLSSNLPFYSHFYLITANDDYTLFIRLGFRYGTKLGSAIT